MGRESKRKTPPLDGAELIAIERHRQVSQEGWTPEHDMAHTTGGLAWAAVCYAAPERVYRQRRLASDGLAFRDPWPWEFRYDKRAERPAHDGASVRLMIPVSERIRELTKAGALIAAEIDRLLETKK